MVGWLPCLFVNTRQYTFSFSSFPLKVLSAITPFLPAKEKPMMWKGRWRDKDLCVRASQNIYNIFHTLKQPTTAAEEELGDNWLSHR